MTYELDKNKTQELSQARIDEAKILLKEKYFSGAYYMAGYSVELALKAVICKVFKHETIPDKKFVQSIYIHKLTELMNLSGLKIKFESEMKSNQHLETHWSIVTKWNEECRYEFKTEQDAISIIEAIENQNNGILSWIKRHW